MIKYLLKKWYYIPIGLIIYIIYLKLFKISFNIVEPVLLVFLIRFIDDFFDFEKDKRKRTSKKNLIFLICFFSLIYIILNLFLYKNIGLLSILIIVYFFLMNKIDILKILVLSLITTYYYLIMGSLNYYVLIITLVISAFFYAVKRWKNDL